MAKKKNKFYVVWQGRVPGVYQDWDTCLEQVKGVEARYKSFDTLAQAELAYREGPDQHLSRSNTARMVGKPQTTTRHLSAEEMMRMGVELPALAVDAACSGNPGKMEYRGVIVDAHHEVFHRGPYEEGTNNIGEFLALVLGLAYLKVNHLPWILYSDSKTAISWVKQKKCKTKIDWTAKNRKLYDDVLKAEEWLRNNTWTTTIKKWDTDHWGEIPADFGRK
jgi:ribonuclease HI